MEPKAIRYFHYKKEAEEASNSVFHLKEWMTIKRNKHWSKIPLIKKQKKGWVIERWSWEHEDKEYLRIDGKVN